MYSTYSNALSGVGGNSVAPRRGPNPRGPAANLQNSRAQQIANMQAQGAMPNQEVHLEKRRQDEQKYWLNQRRHVRRENFFPGMIIRAPYHEEDFANGKDSSLPSIAPGANVSYVTSMSGAKSHISLSNYGYVHSKLRYLIVIAEFKFHYTAVPLYT